MSTPLVLGVAGGGTKTPAALVPPDGRARAPATGGPSNYQIVGRHAAEAVWSELTMVLQSQVEGDIVASAWGLSGCDRHVGRVGDKASAVHDWDVLAIMSVC